MTSITKRRVYISGALTGSRNYESAKDEYEYIGKKIREIGFGIYMPHKKTGLEEKIRPRKVYKKDKKEILKSDILLAILNEPSHGVGAEIFIASSNNIRVIGFYRKNVEVSRFIKGFINNKDGCSYYTYLNIEEIPDKFTKFLSSTNKKCY